MKKIVTAVAAALLLSAVPASADAPKAGSWSFAASTAGLPVGAAVGGWNDGTSGTEGTLGVEAYAVPHVGGLAFSGEWLSEGAVLSPQPGDAPVRVASLTGVTYANSMVEKSTTKVKFEHQVVVDGVVGPWIIDAERTLNSTTTRSSHSLELVLASYPISVKPDRTAEYQVRFRMSGTKTGDDRSTITMQVKRLVG